MGIAVTLQNPYNAVRIFSRDGNNDVYTETTTDPEILIGVLYYGRLERTSPTNARVSVFTDSARTIHVTDSPKNLTIAAGIVGLTHIQHASASQQGDSRTMSWELDQTRVFDNQSP